MYRGRVVKASRGLRPGIEVSVKVLHSHYAGSPDAVSRFKLEAGLGLTLRHPNIVRIFQVGSVKVEGMPVHYLVQEYVQGITLRSLIQEGCILSDAFLRKIARQIAEALLQIHKKGIIHRDLKPENVFLEADGTVKLVDFGFSYVEKSLREQDAASGFYGTVSYAAPERFGPHRAGKASDLYSFGVILYELAVGRNPYLGEDLDATISLHLESDPEEPGITNRYISPFMSRFIMGLLDKDPQRRLGPSKRLTRILAKQEGSRWWKSLRPEDQTGSVGALRRSLTVSRRTRVYGREEETDRLLELWRDVLSGRGTRSVCLIGEAGSGKTRLVDHFLEKMDPADRPGRILTVDGAQGSVKVPYLPLISVLQAAFDLGGLKREELREVLQQKLKAYFPERLKMVDRFARFLISALPKGGGVEPEEIMVPEVTARLFSELFTALGGRFPLIILVENVPEADPPTFHVVTQMLHHLKDAPILVILTARPGQASPEESAAKNSLDALFDAMDETGDRHLIAVKRLDRLSVTRVLCELGFPESVAEGSFGERVFHITEGNPYFLLEIARQVVSENRIIEEKVDWQGLQEEIPSSIQDVFYRRLFRLSPGERQFLDFASVIGIRFRPEEVVEGLGLDFKTAAQVISRLQHRFALIRPVDRFFRFDHVLIRDLLYRNIDPEERAHYHRKAGEYFLSTAAERALTGRDFYRAAVHFSRGGDHARALEFFQKAFDYLRYKHFHDRAYELAGSAVKHIAALRGQGEEPAPSFMCDIYLKQAEVAGFLGDRDVQFRALKEALDAARRSDYPALKALVRLRIGQYYHATSRFISAFSFVESALVKMQRIGDRWVEADALQTLCLILKEIGEDEEIVDMFRRALAIRIELKDEAGGAGVLVDMGEYLLEQGMPRRAREAFTRAGQRYRNLKDERGMAFVLLGLAKIDLETGDLESAERALDEAGRIAVEVGDAALEADVLAAKGTLHLERSDVRKAGSSLAEALQIAVIIKDAVRRVRFLEAQARCILHQSNHSPDLERALAKARLAVKVARKAGLGGKERVAALSTLASVFEKMGKPMSAFAIIRKTRKILKEEGGSKKLRQAVNRRYEILAKELKKDQSRIIRFSS